MSGETLIGTGSILVALVGAIFTGLVSLRHARREVATADVMELRAYREAWIWSVRTIYRLLSMLGAHSIEEPDGIREELLGYQESIDNPQPGHRKESA